MSTAPSTPVQDRDLAAARRGDESAFQRIVEAHRGELHAHCYRMLGSTHDAEDALQEAMLRSWKAIDRFEGRSSVKSWLYRISTNTCLDQIQKRPKQRVLPIDYAPATDPHDGPGAPVIESVWVDPYPDEDLGIEDGFAGPGANYERREAVELAFIAALQHLPANQRAVLILREVLGYSAKETAETLDTTVASVNSAMQRARKAVDERTPDQSQQETIRTLGDEKVKELVAEYIDAWERADVDKVVSMLTEDASFAMPPLASWFGGPDRGRDEIEEFLRLYPLGDNWEWRAIATTANGGQPALGFYIRDRGTDGPFMPFALNVLTFRGEQISDVVAFVSRAIDADQTDYERWPDNAPDPDQLFATFGRFGLPEQLD
jgi:RNA polymerase sigma-70 factor, ECF subfamily